MPMWLRKLSAERKAISNVSASSSWAGWSGLLFWRMSLLHTCQQWSDCTWNVSFASIVVTERFLLTKHQTVGRRNLRRSTVLKCLLCSTSELVMSYLTQRIWSVLANILNICESLWHWRMPKTFPGQPLTGSAQTTIQKGNWCAWAPKASFPDLMLWRIHMPMKVQAWLGIAVVDMKMQFARWIFGFDFTVFFHGCSQWLMPSQSWLQKFGTVVFFSAHCFHGIVFIAQPLRNNSLGWTLKENHSKG